MKDEQKTKNQLINELKELRQQVAEAKEMEIDYNQTKEALKESEKRWRALFESSPEGILIADNETQRLTYSNPALCKLLGYSEKELKKLNIRKLPPEEVVDQVISEIEAQVKGKEGVSSEIPLLTKDGTIRYADIKTTIVSLKGRECLLGFLKDVTKQRETDKALEESVTTTINMVEDIAEHARIERELEEAKTVMETAKLELEKTNRQLEEANKRLQRLTFVDGLTGIANRRHFDQVLDREWRRAQRDQRSLSLIFSDIDFFKNYNDYYGHLQGDDCLKRVAKMLISVARRPGDLVARYGGEEFAVILSDTASVNASKVADKVRKHLLSLKIPHFSSPISDYVTISLGVASSVPTNNSSPRKLIETADKTLYRAKYEGRNRVEVFDGINK